MPAPSYQGERGGADCPRPGTPGDERGSVLIMVLWILALVTMLAGEYMAHNRGKANLAVNALTRFEREGDRASVLALLSSMDFDPGGKIPQEEGWLTLSPSGDPVYVRVDEGDTAVNLNTASDEVVREKIRGLLGEDAELEADNVADAVLDWRDENDLVRTNGAEADHYEGEGLGYTPSNGPFKALTELLMVKGVTRTLFWGDPSSNLPDDSDGGEEKAKDEKAEEEKALAAVFTVGGEKSKRIRIISGARAGHYDYLLVFVEKAGNAWRVVNRHGAVLEGKMPGE